MSPGEGSAYSWLSPGKESTLNFIDIWLKLILDNYNSRCDAYVNAMKEIFKQIPLTMSKSLTPKQKVQKLMTDICGGCYLEKIDKGLPPLRRPKLSKKSQEIRMKFKKSYMKLVSGGIFGNPNCIGTS